MTRVVFDEPGTRNYEYGVDRAVLFLPNGKGVPWNGLSSVEDTAAPTATTHYLDGRPFLHTVTRGAFEGKISAYTYPDEVLALEGTEDVFSDITTQQPYFGYMASNQSPKFGNLVYRTMVGNDLDSEVGYKIHLLYNVLLLPDTKVYSTLGLSTEPAEFVWTLKTTPPDSFDRAFSHIWFDSRTVTPWWLAYLENYLYGDSENDPRFPDPVLLAYLFEAITAAGPGTGVGAITVVDNNNGTWTATDSNGEITIVNGAFTIVNVDALNVTAASYDLVVNN